MIRDTEPDSYDSRLFSENNELIEKLNKKKIQHGIGPRLIGNVQYQGHSLWKRIVMEVAKIDTYLRQEVFN